VPNFLIDNFLRQDFAERVVDAYPPYEDAIAVGRSFRAVNEKGKVQVTDSSRFPEPIRQLNHVLASPEFCELISHALGIPTLLADEKLVGGGMHQTAARGHLDVHVDFNFLEDRGWHRRANLLVFLNRGWKPEWGGEFELWDADVKVRHHAHSPIFNRCVLFETNEVSFHGVTAVKCPPGQTRKSFGPITTRPKRPRIGTAARTRRSSEPGRMNSSRGRWRCPPKKPSVGCARPCVA
jgi:hypothetical protein